MISPKIEIINHFDNLIQRVDIAIEESLEKYNEDQVLGDLRCYENFKENQRIRKTNCLVEPFKLNESSISKSYEIEQDWLNEATKLEEMLLQIQTNKTNEKSDDLKYDKIYKTVDLWSEETKVIDYLKEIRMRTIEELKEAQKEALESYKSQSDDSKSELFPDKFYFQVLYTQSEPEEWIFKLFTFFTDFYMSPDDISLFEKLLNSEEDDFELFTRDSKIIFDEKLILIGLLQKFFFENLKSEKFPSHVISVRKQDLLNIKQITFSYNVNEVNLTGLSTIYLSNLEILDIFLILGRIDLDGLLSLESLCLSCGSLRSLSIKCLPSLRNLHLTISILDSLDSTIKSQVLDYLPSIECLTLKGVLDNFNLDSFVKLKCLSLCECLTGEFNFDLLRNILCYQLEELCLKLENLDDECLSKLLFGCHFPVLKTLSISSSRCIEKIEKKLFVGFPMLQTLSISNNRRLRKIDLDVFSNVKQLISLDLSGNNFDSSNLDKWHFWGLDKLKYLNLSWNAFKTIDENMFSRLKQLKVLDLSKNSINKLSVNSFAGLENLISLKLNDNKLSFFDSRILDNIGQVKQIDLSENNISNKEELLDRFKDKFIF